MTIAAMLRKIKVVDTDKICIDSLTETKDAIADKNRERMNEGIKADGSIMPNYSYVSQVVYGYPDVPIRLKAAGDFQKAITVSVRPDVIETDSSDNKTAMLVGRYGATIFGLDRESKIEYIAQSLHPAFKDKIEAATGLIMK